MDDLREKVADAIDLNCDPETGYVDLAGAAESILAIPEIAKALALAKAADRFNEEVQ